MTEKTFETVISVLIDSKIKAENYNRYGINNTYIGKINSALFELKEMRTNHNKTVFERKIIMKQSENIFVYDVYKHLVRNAKTTIIESGTMKELSLEDAKERKVDLIVPCGELEVNIFVKAKED